MDLLLRKNEELSAILEVSRVLTASFDLEKNLAATMGILSSHLEMQRGCVFLLDPLSRELRIVAAHGLSREAIHRGKYRFGEGIVGQVIESGEPMFIPNIGDEPKFLNKTDSRLHKGGVSFLCMPIALDREVFGVISVDRIYMAEHGNVEDDLRVLRIMASLIAQFVKLWEHFIKAEYECGALRSQLAEKFSLPNIVGESPPFQQVLKSVKKVAATDTTVILLGESGTGKELIAQTLHYQSHRSDGRFVPVNLAALPENLIEVELFGVEKGAYTVATTRRIGRFEHADKGTLFLDEIGELPLALQVKLLRVLQEKTFERIGSSHPMHVDARVVAATNCNLLEAVRRGHFREDLYWRLNVVPIVLPPLRERTIDIPLLLNHYLEKFNRTFGRSVRLDAEAIEVLTAYPWPGNVRELANTVERLVIMTEASLLTAADLPSNIVSATADTTAPLTHPDRADSAGLNGEVAVLERRRIIQALKTNDFVQQKAARTLGITPRQLGYRIKKYTIDVRSL
ncbi:MAG: sigma 54-interacting transcriptional regulator [Desulfobacterales bacterium]